MRHGAPRPGYDAAKPPGRGGRTTATGARRRRLWSGRRNDRGLTEASGPQESGGPPPTTAFRPMSPQQSPSTGSVPEGHLDTTPGHPPPTGTTPHHDRENMPPPPPRPPQRRNMDLSEEEELRAIYDTHANTTRCGLVAALRGNLQNVNQNRLSPWSPCRTPHQPTSLCASSRHS